MLIDSVYTSYDFQILCYLSKFSLFATFYSWNLWFFCFIYSLDETFIIFLNINFYLNINVLILLLRPAFKLLSFHYLLWSLSILFALTKLIKCRLCASVLSSMANLYLELLIFHKFVCILCYYLFFQSKIIYNLCFLIYYNLFNLIWE